MAHNNGERPITEFEDVLRIIRPFGLWQISTCILAAFTGMFTGFFVLIHSFVGAKIPYYCRVPALSAYVSDNITVSATNWTEVQRREFSIPPKIAGAPPSVGQAFQPCLYFSIDYDDYNQLPYQAAWLKRILNVPAPPVEVCQNGWEFNTTGAQYPSSIEMEWTLTCDYQYLLPLSQSIFMLGFLFGVLVSGALSDAYGRKRIMVHASAIAVLFVFITASAPNYTAFVIFRFISAFCLASAYTIGFVLCMEIIGPEHRDLIGFAYQAPWTCGYILLALAAFVIRDWRWLQVALACPCCLMLAYHWLLPESPRWLILRGFVAEARAELERAARQNGVALPSKLHLDKMHRHQVQQQQQHDALRRLHNSNSYQKPTVDAADDIDSDEEDLQAIRKRRELLLATDSSRHNYMGGAVDAIENETPRARQPAPPLNAFGLRRQLKLMWGGLSSLFTYPRTRKRTLIQYFCWFVNSMVYYGLAFHSTRLEGHVYLNFLLGGAVEIPAYIIGYFAYRYWGRRGPLLSSMVLGGFACVAVGILRAAEFASRMPVTTLILSTFGKFCITASFGMVYIYSSELFPTTLRSIGVGSCSTMARLGSAIAPFVLRLGDTMWRPLPMLIFGALAVMSGVLVLLLPETWRAQLPETVEAAESFGVDMRVELQEKEKRHFFHHNRIKNGSRRSNNYTATSSYKLPMDYDDDDDVSAAHLPGSAASPSAESAVDSSMLEVRSGAAGPSPDAMQQFQFDRHHTQQRVAQQQQQLLEPIQLQMAPPVVARRNHHRSSVFSPHMPFARHNLRGNAADVEAMLAKRRLSTFFNNANNMQNSNSSTGSATAGSVGIRRKSAADIDSIERSFLYYSNDVSEQHAENYSVGPTPTVQNRSGSSIGRMTNIPVINIIEASGAMAAPVRGDTTAGRKKAPRDTVDKGSSAQLHTSVDMPVGGRKVRSPSWHIYEDNEKR